MKGCAVLALLLLALVVRLAFVAATPHYVPHHDDRDYDRLACWISDRGLPPDRAPPFPSARSCAEPGRAGELTAYRPPLWPMALGGSDAVAEVVDAPRWTAGRVLQAVIGTVIVGLIGAIASRLWKPAVGLIAMALAAVFLPLVLDGASLISEPLFVALELGAVLAFLHYRAPPHRLRWAIASGALVGLAALTRTSGALVAVALIVAFLTRPRARGLAAAACFAAAAILVVAPWTIRNELVLRAFVPVSTEAGGTLLGTYNRAAWHDPGATAPRARSPSDSRSATPATCSRSRGTTACDCSSSGAPGASASPPTRSTCHRAPRSPAPGSCGSSSAWPRRADCAVPRGRCWRSWRSCGSRPCWSRATRRASAPRSIRTC